MSQRVSFDDSEELPEEKSNVKLDKGRSMFAKAKQVRQTFEEKANQAISEQESTRNETVDIANLYWKIVNDTKLPGNKGPLDLSLEKEALKKITDFATKVNNDPNQPVDGMGSICAIALLLRTVLLHRDQLNAAEYEKHQMQNKLNSFQLKLEELSRQISILEKKNLVESK